MAKGKKKSKNIREEIAVLALKRAAAQGWGAAGLSEIAADAGMALAELREYFDDKDDILAVFHKMVDRRVLENTGAADEDMSPRDRLFDILMERFDILNEYREGVVAVMDSFKSDPKQAVIAAPHLCRSMLWMLESCEIETGGISGALKVAGLTGIYLNVLRVWKTDESKDLAKTMAALDKDLARAEKLSHSFSF